MKAGPFFIESFSWESTIGNGMADMALKSLSLSCAPIGLGTWPLGGPARTGNVAFGRGDASPAQAKETVASALEAGITFFDTADIYGAGRAEEILGAGLAASDDAIVCTKFGNRILEGGIVQDFSKDWLQQSVAESLSRLRRRNLDILLLHSPPADFDWDNYDRAPLDRLVNTGMIKGYGVSCRSVAASAGVIAAGFGSVLEVIYNVLDRRAQAVFAAAEGAGYDIIARMPFAYGILMSGNERVFGKGDHRSRLSSAERIWITEAARRLEFLRQLPGGIAASALRFAVSDPRVSVVIAGMHKPAHVEAAAIALREGPLPSDALGAICAAVPETFAGW
jgi:aryl-alcohol dehydrogenase-like predicted oxidoreductase